MQRVSITSVYLLLLLLTSGFHGWSWTSSRCSCSSLVVLPLLQLIEAITYPQLGLRHEVRAPHLRCIIKTVQRTAINHTPSMHSSNQRSKHSATQYIILPAVVLREQPVNVRRRARAHVCHKQADQLWRDVVVCWVDHLHKGLACGGTRVTRNNARPTTRHHAP